MELEKRRRRGSICFLHWMYYGAGGIYASSEFSARTKYLWLSLNFAAFCLIVSGGVGYVITAESLVMLDAASVLWVSTSAVFIITVIPFITCYYHKNFEKLFKYLENNSDAINSDETIDRKLFLSIRPKQSLLEALFWLKLITCVVLAFFLLPGLDVLFFSQDKIEAVRNIQHHLVGIPYVHLVPSLGLFWALYIAEICIVGFMVILAFFEPPLLIMIVSELNNVVFKYCYDLQVLSDLNQKQFEEYGDERDYASEERADKCNEFENKLKISIRRYQEFIRTIQLIRPYVQIFSTALLFAVSLVLCSNILAFLLIDSKFFLKIKLFAVSTLCPIYLYPHCKLGTIFNDMNEAVTRQVYNLSWYYLPARRRKIVYIFLNQTQRPIVFKAFWMFPVNIILLPKLLRLAYSFANVLAATPKVEHETS